MHPYWRILSWTLLVIGFGAGLLGISGPGRADLLVIGTAMMASVPLCNALSKLERVFYRGRYVQAFTDKTGYPYERPETTRSNDTTVIRPDGVQIGNGGWQNNVFHEGGSVAGPRMHNIGIGPKAGPRCGNCEALYGGYELIAYTCTGECEEEA